MKQLVVTFALAVAAMTPQAEAVLSPLHQSIAELRSLIQSPDLARQLPPSQPIIGIHRAENGYTVLTEELQMLVEVHYSSVERPGPAQFTLTFHPPTPQYTQ